MRRSNGVEASTTFKGLVRHGWIITTRRDRTEGGTSIKWQHFDDVAKVCRGGVLWLARLCSVLPILLI